MTAAMAFLDLSRFTQFMSVCLFFCHVASPVVPLSGANMFGTKTQYIESLSALTKKALTELSNRGSMQEYHYDFDFDTVTTSTTSSGREPNGTQLLNDVCRPIHINFLGRHGIRNPGQSDIKTIHNLVEKLRKMRIDHALLEALEKSIADFTVETEKELTATGRDELSAIGERFVLRFPELFTSVTSESELVFQVTGKSRTVDSCKAFVSSFVKKGIPVASDFTKRDDILRFFDRCERYVSEVDDNKNALGELQIFKEKYFSEIGDAILANMGLNPDETSLSHREVKAVYIMAASELAVRNSTTWARFLGPQELRLLEYAGDLKHYWKKGYGYRINYDQSCGLLTDIFSHLQSAADDGQTKGVFRFAHAETLLPLSSLLGLFRDPSPLKADAVNDERHFKTSAICPFASNFAFVLYSCDAAKIKGSDIYDELGFRLDAPLEWGSRMLRVLYNEDNIHLPFARSHLIPLDQVLEHYGSVSKNCNWNEMCSFPKEEL